MKTHEPEAGMTERRSEKRRQLHIGLQVYDGVSSRIVGHVVDLTRTGMMLICSEPIGVQEEYRLRIKFPDSPGRNPAELNVRAVCRWCREDVAPETFVAGFHFHDILAEESGVIASLINEFSLLKT